MAEQIPDLSTLNISLSQAVLDALPPDVVANLGTLMTIFKTLGIIVIIYIIFLIISSVFNIRRGLMIKRTYKLVKEINEKLDKVLHKGKSEKEHKSEKEKKENSEKKGKGSEEEKKENKK